MANRLNRIMTAGLALGLWPVAASAQFLVVGNDEKISWDDKGTAVISAPGKDTVSMVDAAVALALTPAGKRALAAKPVVNKVAVLEIDAGKVTYNKLDITTGIFPYNLVIAGGGRVAITADNGAGGASDGNVDTV